jgi:hypothetical protein
MVPIPCAQSARSIVFRSCNRPDRFEHNFIGRQILPCGSGAEVCFNAPTLLRLWGLLFKEPVIGTSVLPSRKETPLHNVALSHSYEGYHGSMRANRRAVSCVLSIRKN